MDMPPFGAFVDALAGQDGHGPLERGKSGQAIGLGLERGMGSATVGWIMVFSAVVTVRQADYIADERERASPFAMIVTIHRGALPDRSSLTDRTRPKTVDPLSFSAVGSPLYWARRQR